MGKSTVNDIRIGKSVPSSEEQLRAIVLAWTRCAPPPITVDVSECLAWYWQLQRDLADQRRRSHPGPAGGPRQPLAGPRLRFAVGVVPDPAGAFQHRGIADEVYAALTANAVILSGEAERARILSGLGGVGKTQVAADVARRLRNTGAVDALFWVTAASRQAIVASYAAAAAEVGTGDPTNADAAAQAFRQWLSRTELRWLMVLDDLTGPADLQDLWPPASATGRTVITTRRRDAALASRGTLVPVGLFTPQEAHAYLSDTLHHDPRRLVEAGRLAADLGYLPLAMGQAAAFIADQNLTCATYRQQFATARNLVDVLPQAGE
jgi:hypothetical protein